MKSITQEWVDKAEGDFVTAQRELQAKDRPNYDAVCFHSQQCVEKYLKACLQETDTAFDKTHDLSILLNLYIPSEPTWKSLHPVVSGLTMYAVQFRYPGESADQDAATEALKNCSQIRELVRCHLKLTGN
jgi:HEPN domain-containing protein